MIYELARLTIDPARAAAFEAAVAGCAPLFRGATGCSAMALEREIETPGRYVLRVAWASVDDHMIGFRTSPAFAAWRAAVGGFFQAAPDVCHTEALPIGF